ncbi:MAG: tRNA preQ1(34) S-adenosylmethionine ribosyltransferase-isomerase QueA [Chloroflexi bacterium]|nr:tRNA preQ1(34) S-adenosylmethionine ribosyltransferase-isomerase QueA [Chloroflexota bacterium]
MDLKTSDFDYHLPPELIAQRPIEPRDHSRLLVLDRATGAITHRRFHEIGDYLRPGDLLVMNDSRVIPARLHAKRPSGGKAELLLLHPMSDGVWQALARPARRLPAGTRLALEPFALSPSKGGQETRYEAEVVSQAAAGIVGVRVSNEAIEACGQVPLPPYIREPLADRERYQTVYARVNGSAAAPTAGLHFTPDLLKRLGAHGVTFAFVTLHIGLDTFRPVEVEEQRKHHIHREYALLDEATARRINEARSKGGRIVSIGTTAARVLETAARGAQSGQAVAPYTGWTDLMILPGHAFRAIDILITNFHLPRSTLLMLVSAFAGKQLIDKAYAEAVRERYRFYSFGDAVVIL